MKTLFVFNHPAPYKVHVFNELNKLTDIQVIFEREKAKDRPASFYGANKYDFPVIFFNSCYFSNENTFTGKVKKYVKKHHSEYDVIVMNGYSTIAEMRTIKYLIKHHIKYVLQINGGVIKKENSLKKKIKTYYISHAYKYLSPCLEADKYLEYYGARKEDILHYPYGNFFDKEIVAKPVDAKTKEEIRKKWNLPNGKIFVNASQFIERKNNIQLIELFKNREENLLLIGSGKEKEQYQKIIDEHNISNIKIIDFLKRDELFEVLKGCDYFITLSFQDIFGHTTVEAMANGLPVISSDRVVSSLDLIEDGKNGYIVDIEDNDKIISAIENIDKCSSELAIQTAKEHTIEKTASSLAGLLKEIAL